MADELYSLGTQMEVPDVAEPVLGFRCWDYSDEFNGIFSLHGVWRLWPSNTEFKAICAKYVYEGNWERWQRKSSSKELLENFGDGNGNFVHPAEAYKHRAPSKQCQCGIYAAYDANIVIGYADTVRVFGLIAAWGLVIPASNGFRAEYAKPVCFFDIEQMHTVERRKLKAVADNYSVPFIVPHSLNVEDYREGVRTGDWTRLAKS
jgi:hypothetical protein